MGSAEGTRPALLDAAWRQEALARQCEVLPPGEVVATCGVPFGSGGLGRHLAEIMAALERAGRPGSYLAADNRATPLRRRPLERLTRSSPGRRVLRARTEFDEYAATQLPHADSLMAFNRQALAQFARAGALGYSQRTLVTGSPHVRRVERQHARAYERDPIERSFGTYVVERYLSEYQQADAIYVASKYTLDSFLEQGIARERLRWFPLTPDPRFTPGTAQPIDTFEVVYVGSISVAKGIPVLIDAFRSLAHEDLRLRLVGSTKSRPMARWLARQLEADARISAAPGDPLAVLRTAGLCVHPTWEDGFAYAPAEALACGVPVAVSADTGMAELVESARNGTVVPTGDASALADAIDAAYLGRL